MSISRDQVLKEFSRRQRFIDQLKVALGPTSYAELAELEGATKTAVYNALTKGDTGGHERTGNRLGPPRSQLLQNISKTMSPMSDEDVCRILRELADATERSSSQTGP